MSKIVLITRYESKDKNEADFVKLDNWLKSLKNIPEVNEIIILCNRDDIGKIKNLAAYDKNLIKTKLHDKPSSPTAMNIVINELKKTKAFIIASREVEINSKNIQRLIIEIENDDKLLVAGYKFRITNKKLNRELQKYYKNKDLIAYQVPWNTCAIWSFNLFIDYVKEFNEITNNSIRNEVCVCVNSVCGKTPHKGMEDGLAIAKALSITKGNIHFKLILDEAPLLWSVNTTNHEAILMHQQKLARKDIVLRNFMSIMNYFIQDLKKSNVS